MTMLPDGRYTVVYPSGDYRSIRVRTVKDGPLKNRVILSLRNREATGANPKYKWTGCGFLEEAANESGVRVRFWYKFRQQTSPQRLERIAKAVERVARDPQAAVEAYGMQEGRCMRCDRPLSVPASLAHGLG